MSIYIYISIDTYITYSIYLFHQGHFSVGLLLFDGIVSATKKFVLLSSDALNFRRFHPPKVEHV